MIQEIPSQRMRKVVRGIPASNLFKLFPTSLFKRTQGVILKIGEVMEEKSTRVSWSEKKRKQSDVR